MTKSLITGFVATSINSHMGPVGLCVVCKSKSSQMKTFFRAVMADQS